MTTPSLRRFCIAASLALACGTAMAGAGDPPHGAATDASVDAGIPALREVRDDLLVSGQPAADAWATLKAQGVTTVVNLRPQAEVGERDERAEVEAAGLAYHAVPVAGTEDLTPDNASRLWALVHGADGRVLAHCASGNRVGALLALGAANEGGMSPEAALAFGKSAGLTSPKLEAEVRTRLGLPAAAE